MTMDGHTCFKVHGYYVISMLPKVFSNVTSKTFIIVFITCLIIVLLLILLNVLNK